MSDTPENCLSTDTTDQNCKPPVAPKTPTTRSMICRRHGTD